MTDAPPPPAYTGAPQPLNPADEKTWSIVIHIAGIFFSFIPALIAYLAYRGRGPFLEAHSKTALNFQLSFLIYSVAIGILSIPTFGIASLLFLPLAVIVIVFSIIAAVKASSGQYYSYPLTIPLIK